MALAPVGASKGSPAPMSRSEPGSESAATVEEDENDGRASKGDQGQSPEISDQMKVETHGRER